MTVKIGEYFTLEELTASDTARARGVSNVPGAMEMANLRALVKNVLDPLRKAAGVPVAVSSGYRSPRVNALVGGSPSSQHLTGMAADITVRGKTPIEVVDLIRRLDLPFDQLIEEFGRWVHVSYSPRNRRQVLRAHTVNGRTQYSTIN